MNHNKKSQKTRWSAIIFIWIFAFLGCIDTKMFNDLDEFEKYLKGKDSPYLQTITQNGVKISLRYMPTDAVMISTYRQYLETRKKVLKNKSLSNEQRTSRLNQAKEELLKRKKAYDQSLYFYLIIGYEDESKDIVYEKMRDGYGEYSQWLQKMMFALTEYIYLQTPSIDEIPLGMYHMERTFGMRKDRTFLLMFPSQFNGQDILNPDNKWLRLQIDEFGLSTGHLTFMFKLPLKRVQFQMNLL